VVAAVFLVAIALFAPFSIVGDGTFYYDLTRRFVGDGGIVYSYQWGVSLWNAPFYVVWHALGMPYSDSPPHALGEPFDDGSVTVAAAVAAVAAVLVARRIVALLGLPSNTLLVLGTLFGTQLWFYGIFLPSYSHAIDALTFTVACYLLVRLWQGAPPCFAGLLGAVLAGLVTIRYANAAALPGFLLPLLLRRDGRTIAHLVSGALAGSLLLLLLPLLLGTGFGTSADIRRGYIAPSGTADVAGDLLIPLKMLLSPERGLFAYAPLCAIALVGFILVLLRPSPNRVPLASIAIASLGILLVYTAVGSDWVGGGLSYGQRFLTSLAVVTLIGLAELKRRAPRMTAVAVLLCTAWSLFIGINFAYGWSGVTNDTRNADDIVRLYVTGERTLPGFVRLVAFRLRERFNLTVSGEQAGTRADDGELPPNHEPRQALQAGDDTYRPRVSVAAL
jgi:hypothetical protein